MITQNIAKFLFTLVVCLLPSISNADPTNSDSRVKASQDLKKIFHRPVIIGASISSGFITESPGERAARRFTARQNITNQARSGAEGEEFTDINQDWAKQFSIIIGVDFLFWDSTLASPAESIRALKNLEASAVRAGVPLVLGDIPSLRTEQVTREVLNKQIHATCKVKNGCYIIPFDQIHRQAETVGIVIDGQRYFYRDLTFDGLHLNAFGSEYVARLIIGLLGRGM
jgi:hypothetical protein